MSPLVLFIFVCLSPMAVICVGRRWTPREVPSRTSQCKMLNPSLAGECSPIHNDKPDHQLTGPCHSLKCAWGKPDGTFRVVEMGRPVPGTSCGNLKACNRGRCLDIVPSHVPLVTGIGIMIPCTTG